jgi:signal transduction histidine kinase
MLFEKIKQFIKTLAFRLTIYYAAIFTVSAVGALFVIYLVTSTVLLKNLDLDLQKDVEEYGYLLKEEGIKPLLKELQVEAANEGSENFFFRLISAEGKEILTSGLTTWQGLEEAMAVVEMIDTGRDEIFFQNISSPELEYEARVAYAKLAPGIYMQMGESKEENDEILEVIVGVFIRTLLLILPLGAVTGWFMARRALAGVEEVTRTARRISKGDFTHRVPIKSRGYEIERLATTFNYMLDRINALISGIREVTDNIAHDLRSPITSMRGTVETTLMNTPNIADYKHMAGNTIEECDRLLGMINAMLDISEAETGAESLDIQAIDVPEVVRQACELFQPLAEEKDISLTLKASNSCHIRGDIKKIQRLVANLLDNALKYTSPGGAVSVEVACGDKGVEVRVDDNGIGIAGDELPHIFQRFFRSDQSRSQEGTGLGLSLAQAIAHAHGGCIDVQSEPGKGSSFVLKLPKAEL